MTDRHSARPAAGEIRPTDRDPENENIIVLGPFYRVTDDIRRAPIRDYLDHGYETRQEFCDAVRELISRWGGREAECFEERARHGAPLTPSKSSTIQKREIRHDS